MKKNIMNLLIDIPTTYSKVNFKLDNKTHSILFTDKSGFKRFIVGSAKQLDEQLRKALGADYMREIWLQRQAA